MSTTALRKYQRLECSGLWRPSPEAQRREVIVGLREATLVLSDPKTEMALSQWSLPAIERRNPGQMPALFQPGAEDAEQVEIDDPEMISSLEMVHVVLERRKPHPGRLRGLIVGVLAVSITTLAVFWLPGRLISYTASVLPLPTRQALGALALSDLERLTGTPCSHGAGPASAAKLAARVVPAAPPQVLVVRDGLKAATHLPGSMVLLPASLLNETDGPDVAAGQILAEAVRAETQDPVTDLLRHAGLIATIRLLATGILPRDAIVGYGESLLARAPQPIDNNVLLGSFKAADLSSSPYALSLDPTGASTLPLIEGDPFLGGSPRLALTDGDWLVLQAICSD
ncbi:MAG: hypothetical protein KBF27_03910 [Cypionkella sp.]|nr:hypothetical protein [Cypionkella sp.]